MKRSVALASFAASFAVVATLAAPAVALDQAGRDWLEARLAENAAGRFDTAAFTPAFGGGDTLVDAIVTWDRLRRDNYRPTFSELTAFLAANPGWPLESPIRARAERSVDATTPMAARIAHFARFAPRTGGGMFRLAEALAATGRGTEAAAWARRAWGAADLPMPLEAELLARFAPALTPGDHANRADALLWARNPAGAARLLPLLAPDARLWAAARIAHQTGQGADAAVPPAFANDPGLLIDRARALLKRGDTVGAWQGVAATAVAPGTARDPVAWMRFRLGLARDAEKAGAFDIAYRIAAGHNAFAMGRALNDRGLAERDAFTDIEWLAGWVALHDLARPADALRHFARYQAGAKTPTTRAKGLYWAARAAEAAGDAAQARRFLSEAGEAPEAFYGQLALERLGVSPRLALGPAPTVSTAERALFDGRPIVAAARALGEIGARDRQTSFLRALAAGSATLTDRRLIADLGARIGRPDLGVIVGRLARAEGEPLTGAMFPRLAPGVADELWSIAHAITRQETQFDRAAVSAAGARGLMQLMPATAREQAMKVGLPFELKRLTDDEAYNVTLGADYYRRLLAQWGGSHVLAVASYNAGAGNVRRWVGLNGDPRAGVEPIAWIEAIPFAETRSYVQRVLENAVVYDAVRGSAARTPELNRLSHYLGKATPG